MIHRRDRILPGQLLFRNQRAEIADDRAHVTMGKLEPCSGKRVGELIGMLVEAARDLLVSRIEAQREIGSQHRRRMAFGWIMRIRHGTIACPVFWPPLMCAGRALGKFPFKAEQVVEEIVAPLSRCLGPGDFQTAADGISAETFAELILPTKTLVL